MPTLLIQDGFKFFFYANEHLPIHVHIIKGNGYAKINLSDLQVVDNFMKPAELKVSLELVAEHKSEFMEKWNDFFNKRQKSFF